MRAESGEFSKRTDSGNTTASRLRYFDSLLSSLSSLVQNDDECVHIAYSVVLETVSSEENLRLLAEALHERWLADPGFAPVAARLTLKLGDMRASGGDVRLASLVLALVMNDFGQRRSMRRASPHIFRNSIHFAFEFYNCFRSLNDTIYQSLSGSLFAYLNALLDDQMSDDEDIALGARLLHRYGAVLQSLSCHQTQEICLKMRQILVEERSRTMEVRALLLESLELSINRWDDLMPAAVKHFYCSLSVPCCPLDSPLNEMEHTNRLSSSASSNQTNESLASVKESIV